MPGRRNKVPAKQIAEEKITLKDEWKKTKMKRHNVLKKHVTDENKIKLMDDAVYELILAQKSTFRASPSALNGFNDHADHCIAAKNTVDAFRGVDSISVRDYMAKCAVHLMSLPKGDLYTSETVLDDLAAVGASLQANPQLKQYFQQWARAQESFLKRDFNQAWKKVTTKNVVQLKQAITGIKRKLSSADSPKSKKPKVEKDPIQKRFDALETRLKEERRVNLNFSAMLKRMNIRMEILEQNFETMEKSFKADLAKKQKKNEQELDEVMIIDSD